MRGGGYRAGGRRAAGGGRRWRGGEGGGRGEEGLRLLFLPKQTDEWEATIGTTCRYGGEGMYGYPFVPLRDFLSRGGGLRTFVCVCARVCSVAKTDSLHTLNSSFASDSEDFED